jgi:capsular exopolysaccharide synthesis family protein
MQEKKFRLSDINRKLNEERGSDQERSSQQSPENGAAPKENAASADRSFGIETPVSSTPDTAAPPRSGLFARSDAAPTPLSSRAEMPPDPVMRRPHEFHQKKNDALNDKTGAPPPAPGNHAEPTDGKHPPHRNAHQQKTGEGDDIEFDLFRYIGIILRRKNVVLGVTLLLTIFSIFQYMKGEKFYVTHARLLFKPAEKELINIGEQNFGYYDDRINAFNTHLELLKSNTVVKLVSDNLNNRVRPYQIQRSLIIQQGQTNREKNDIIELTYQNADPEIARDVLNELCKTYIDYRLEVNSQEVTRLLYKIEVQINKFQEELNKKESALRKFKEENRMVELSSETNLTVSKISQMELALQETQLALVESKEKLTGLSSQISKQELNIVASFTVNDPIKEKIAALELEKATLSAENSPEHFKVRMLSEQIEKLKMAAIDSITRDAASKTLVKNPIRQSLVQDLVNMTIQRSSLEAKRTALEKVIEQLNGDLLKLPSMEQRYAFLQRETESLLQTLKLLNTKYDETKIRRDGQETDIKILELAELPRGANSSVKPITIFMGIIIGLILGIALAFLLEYLDQSVKDPIQVEKSLDISLLGIVPLIETKSALIQKSTDLEKKILEPFRSLRANLKHLASTYNCKTFIICSAIKGEGKTTLAANLAITFALDGKRTILVDADLRRSQMHTLFTIPKETGITDYLRGTKNADDILKKTVYDNLCVITSGERPHNPAELVGTYRFDLLIKELRERADIVIYDSPALLPVSDTLTMAPKMDGCIMVFRTTWTPIKAAKQARFQLSRMGCHILGGIFNGVSLARSYYPYYYGYYGYYSYTKYSYEEEPKKRFSMRQFGLQVENSFKQYIRGLRFALPKLIGSGSYFFRRLIKKPSFLILLGIFLFLTGWEFWLRFHPAPESSDESGITYIGVGKSGNGGEGVLQHRSPMPYASPDSLGVKAPAVPSNTADSAARDTASRSTIDSSKTGKPPSVPENPPAPKSGKANSPAVTPESGLPFSAPDLRDSMNRWFAASIEGDVARYLSLYDSSAFTFAGGSFTQWREKARTALPEIKKQRVSLDSMWKGAAKPPFVEMNARIVSIAGQDTSRRVVTTVWKNGARGWKIITEK